MAAPAPETTDIIIGIDPGKTGSAVALDVKTGRVVWAKRVPMVGKEYDLPGMVDILEVEAPQWCVMVAIEKQSTRPVESSHSALATGRGWGTWEGIAAALKIPQELVTPQRWHKALVKGRKGGTYEERKEAAVLAAKALFPDLTIPFKRDWTFADAALIAEVVRREL